METQESGASSQESESPVFGILASGFGLLASGFGRRAFLLHGRRTERSAGVAGRDSASISSEKPGENPGRRKSKDS